MGSTLTPRQQWCLEQLRAFADVATVDLATFDRRGRWREWARGRIGPTFDGRVILEIGCSDGGFLARVAERRSATLFVGLDWQYGDVLHAAQTARDAALRNVALIRGRAQDLRQLFAPHELDELWLFHPEPVGAPLFDEPLLLDAHAVLQDASSRFVLKTDHAGYYQRALAMLGLTAPDWPIASPRARLRDLHPPHELPPRSDAIVDAFEPAVNAADFWNDAAAQSATADRAFAGLRTAYEQRFHDKRRPIFFLDLRPRAGGA